MSSNRATDPDGWRVALEECAGTIVGVEDTHPDNKALRTAAAPFLAYVKTIQTSVDPPLPIDVT